MKYRLSGPRLRRKQFGCLVAVAALAFVVSACNKSPARSGPGGPATNNAVAITVAPVILTPLDRTLQVVGSLLPRNDAVVSAQVEGQVEETLVDFGERVNKGQELARIDTESYDSLLRVADANVARARASLLNARKTLERIRSLEQSNISPASELDTATAQEQQAEAELKSAEASQAIARLNVSRSRVRSPFAGGVAERLVDVGDYVKSGAGLFRVVDDTELKFVFQVPERYAGKVRNGQAVAFRVDALPEETFQGTVYLVSPSVTPANRSFNVAALVPNPQGKLKANTFAQGDLLLEKNVATPVVPLSAIVNFAGITKAFVIEQEVARLREVQVGRVHGEQQEVLQGLKPGEQVATSGTTRLYDGVKVRVKTGGPET